MKHEPLFIIVDLFCGFGGTTTGFAEAEINGIKIAKIIACVNHDPKAIKSHWLNHKDVKHFEEDIRTLDLAGLIAIVKKYRKLYPNAKLILWASLECTNFSKAKGGQAREADSRTLAEHLNRYVAAINPDYIQIENVVEFRCWGPLDSNGKPISRKNGQDYMKWCQSICDMGYKQDWKEINSADLGAYTSRNRLFGCFALPHLPIIWPEATHSKKGTESGMFGSHMKQWKPVKEVLNFSDEGESIFSRKKALSDKTLDRIFAGLIKYVAKGDKSFIQKYYSGRPAGKVIPVTGPAGTITTAGGQQLVQTEFLAHYYGNGYCTSTEEPCPTLRTKDGATLVKYFINRDFTGGGFAQSIDNPAGCLMPSPKINLVEATPFIMDTQFNNGPKSIDQPHPVITANRKHSYIVNPSHGGHCTSTEVPCPVIVARQDKAPLYFVQAEKGNLQIPVYDTDTEICIKIKQFMAEYGLVDIKMRMLRVPELLKIQGFPDNYKMVGNQTDHKKFIGNSVVPKVPKSWAEALAMPFIELLKAA